MMLVENTEIMRIRWPMGRWISRSSRVDINTRAISDTKSAVDMNKLSPESHV
jgi:hypothetical protein